MRIHFILVFVPTLVYSTPQILLDDLLKNYTPLIRPRSKIEESISVNVTFALTSFGGLNEKRQIMSITGWWNITWYDEFLKWDKERYNISSIVIPSNLIWLPDIVIMNGEDDYGIMEKVSFRLVIQHNGEVSWFPGGRYNIFCKMDIQYFPFEKQECYVSVASWNGEADRIHISGRPPEFDTGFYTDSPQWYLDNLVTKHFHYKYYDQTIQIVFSLHRKPTFYVLMIIVPAVTLSLISNFVFILPVESGEKISFSVSILLSYIVLMTLTSGILPDNSDQISILGIYFGSLLFFSALKTCTSVFVLYLHHHNIPLTRNKVEESMGERKLHQVEKNTITAKHINNWAFVIFISMAILINITFITVMVNN